MQILTIDVGGTTALFELQLAGHTEQYKIPTGEGFKIEELNNQIAALERDYDLQATKRLFCTSPGTPIAN